MSKIEKAFKPYVLKVVTEKGAVFEQTLYLAAADELEAERDAQVKPDLSKAISTKELVDNLNKDTTMGSFFKQLAVEHGAQVFPVKKKGLLDKLKGLFQ